MLIKRLCSKIIFEGALLFAMVLATEISAQECKAKVDVNTNNPQTLVMIDTLIAGRGNVKTVLSLGIHIIRIKEAMYRWGQKEIVDTIRVLDCSKPLTLNYDFTPLHYGARSLGFYKTDGKNGESFFSSSTFKILIGSAAVLVGVAAYFKIRADKKYDEYLRNQNQSTLDEVDRLDLISGISFGLLQINFGYLIYKFLTE